MSDSYFEKQRDLLVQEIGVALGSVNYNLDILNRSLAGLVSVGKEFEEVARLWSHFYDGANELRERAELIEREAEVPVDEVEKSKQDEEEAPELLASY